MAQQPYPDDGAKTGREADEMDHERMLDPSVDEHFQTERELRGER